VHGGDALADRSERLAAVLVDALIGAVVAVPIMMLGGYLQAIWDAAQAGRQVGFAMQVGWGIVGLVLFVLLQGYPLARWAQTWGKRALGIRIVLLDGRQPSLSRLLLRRYLPMNVVALVPFVGNVVALVDSLMIFRRDRRCAHDLIAGTRVVKAGTRAANAMDAPSDQVNAPRSAASSDASASGG
jgi:uncharacterized RDD family membrane protein YckC